jgi:hypothetical protein
MRRTLNRGDRGNLRQAVGLQTTVLDSTTFPLGTDEIANYLREPCDEDTMLALLPSAVNVCKQYLGHSLSKETIRAYWQNVPFRVKLPLGPHDNLVVERQKDDGTYTELTAGHDYIVLGDRFKEIEFRTYINVSTYDGNNRIRATFTSGYDVGSPQLKAMKTAVLKVIADMYFNRSSFADKSMYNLPVDAQMILNVYKEG